MIARKLSSFLSWFSGPIGHGHVDSRAAGPRCPARRCCPILGTSVFQPRSRCNVSAKAVALASSPCVMNACRGAGSGASQRSSSRTIGVGAQGRDLDHGGPHRHVAAENAQRPGSLLQGPAARSGRHESAQHDRVPRLGQPLPQVVQNAPAGHHARRRNDHRRARHVVDLLATRPRCASGARRRSRIRSRSRTASPSDRSCSEA